MSEIAALSARARVAELRVDEAATHTNQGRSTVTRRGIPSSGAEPGVTYNDVEVGLEVDGAEPSK